MAVSNLNVRVGFLFDEKGLKQLERQMRSAGQRLSGLGNQLTTAVSIPLGLLGVGAIKAAGDLEALQLAMRATFEGAGRSISEADAELQNLRKSALAPGLDFEQAVRASVRLQNVGFTAEKAREVIEQLANSIATTGGTADDLNEVTQQFAQMIGKGKIFQDDLKIIVGRMPLLSNLMKETFGTTTAEGLNALGVDARKFVDIMTAKMAELPRVSGGIANSIVNMFSSMKNSAATLGLAMNKAFDITGKLDAFAAMLSAGADGFSALNPTIQAVILSMGALFFAVGPLTSLLGIMTSNWAALVGVWGGIVSAAKAVQLWVLNVAAAFRTLSLATQSFILIGVAIAIATVVTQLGLFNHELTNVEKAQMSVNQLMRESAQSVEKEKAQVGELVKVVQNQNAKYGDRVKAIEALKRISPEYFGQLSLEKENYGGLTTAVGGYIKSLVDAETVRRAVARKAEIEIEKQNVGLNTTTTLWQDVKAAALGFGSPVHAAAQGAKYFAENVQATNERLGEEGKLLDDVIAKHGGVVASTNQASAATAQFAGTNKAAAKAVKEQKTELDIYLDRLHEQESLQNKIRQAAASMGLAPLDSLAQAGTGEVDSKTTASLADLQSGSAVRLLPNLPDIGDQFVKGLTPAQALFEALSSDVLTFNEAFALMAENISTNSPLMQQALLGVANSVTAFAEGGGASIGGFVNALVDGAKKAIGAYIRMGVAAVVAKALTASALNPFAALAVGAIAGAAAQTLFNGLLSKIKIPAFAKGTDYAPGGLSLVGERGPELVTLPRGSQVTPNNRLGAMLGGGSGVNVSGEFVIKGTDLVVVLEKVQQQQKRIRGF